MAATMDVAALLAQIEELKKKNEQLEKAKNAGLRLKVSEKGCVSLYGLNRMPTTLYMEQWERLLNHADTIREFIEANRHKLATSEDKARAKAAAKSKKSDDDSDEL
jgi:hypothetical protein